MNFTFIRKNLHLLEDYVYYNLQLCLLWIYKITIRPIIANYSFIVTRPHGKNLHQNAAWKLIIWSRMEKKGIQNRTNNMKIDSENKSIFVI